ncbi:MAG: YXWGXW repeat-containing protein [Deltaproteobacteria bacterium]|nr:YXWGXW repeat-containing protein [Deltaproteobacteria bacterium]
MRFSLPSLALAVTMAASASGCVVTARGHVEAPAAVVEVDEEPPPPRYETVEVRPGFVFITGHWYRAGGRWEWRQGYWERERAGYTWEPGRWEARGRGHVWVEGNWRAGGGGPVVRDHREQREERREERHEDGPVIRDHRH